MGNEEKKKERENQCLNKAVALGLKQHGKSLQIIQRLASPDFDNCDHERPDFIKLYQNPQKEKSLTLVGIEHFRVDKMSLLKKNNKVASTGVVANKKVEDLFIKYHEEITQGNIPESVYADIGETVANHITEQYRSSYNTLLEAFKHSLNLHLASVDDYRKNLAVLSCNKLPIELIFLIEVHADFSGLYCVDDRGISKRENNLMPMFESLVQFMEDSIDPRKVNYVVLCLENSLGCGECKIIAFSTKDIRKELKRQRIRIYEYAGEDLQYPQFSIRNREFPVTPSYDLIEDGANLKFSIQKDYITLSNFALQEMERACQYIAEGKNVIITSAVCGCFSGIQESCFNRENNTNDKT